jgi:hypothetical protein
MASYRETFTKLQNDLEKFNPNELILVTYDKTAHHLILSQIGQSIVLSYISPYFLPKKGFKLGVLNQRGLADLKYNLQELLKNNLIDEGIYIPDLMENQTDWYRFFGSASQAPIPEKIISLKYVNITAKFWVKYTCMHYNHNSKLLYKVLTEFKKPKA